MRFIMIEKNGSTERVLINVDNIAHIESCPDPSHVGYPRQVWIYTSGGKGICTKFTDVEHAVDYIQRATGELIQSWLDCKLNREGA